MEMMSVTMASMSLDMVALSRCQTLNLDLTDGAMLSTARANSSGRRGSPCWMPITDSIGRP